MIISVSDETKKDLIKLFVVWIFTQFPILLLYKSLWSWNIVDWNWVLSQPIWITGILIYIFGNIIFWYYIIDKSE